MTEADLQEFLAWSRNNGIVFDDVEIRSAGPDRGYGVFAKRSFRPEERLITVPHELHLTGGKVADMEKYADIADRSNKTLTPFEMLTIFFALEDEEDPEWGPYLKMLPQTFDTPCYLGIDINPEHLPNSTREVWETQHREMTAAWGKIERLLPEITRERFVWAFNVVNTRCIYHTNRLHPKLKNTDIGGNTCTNDPVTVIPFIDMMNHVNDYQCLFVADNIRRVYVAKANRTVIEGHEAFFSYGPHWNGKLWLEYGFTLQDNIHTKIPISVELLVALAREIGIDVGDEHKEALYKGNLTSSLYASDEGPSWQLLTNMKMILLDKKAVKNWRIYAVQNNDSFDYDDEDLHLKRTVHNTLLQMLTILRNRMDRRRTAAPADLHWLWDEDLGLIDVVLNKCQAVVQEMDAMLAARAAARAAAGDADDDDAGDNNDEDEEEEDEEN